MLALCPGAALAVGMHLACPPPRGPEGAGIWGLGLRGWEETREASDAGSVARPGSSALVGSRL